MSACVLPACTVTLDGSIVTEIEGTVMVVAADCEASAFDVAVMVTVVSVDGGLAGAL